MIVAKELVDVIGLSEGEAERLAKSDKAERITAAINAVKKQPALRDSQAEAMRALLGPAPAARAVAPPPAAKRPEYWLDLNGQVSGPLTEAEAMIDSAKAGALLCIVGRESEGWKQPGELFKRKASRSGTKAKTGKAVWLNHAEGHQFSKAEPPEVDDRKNPPIWPFSVGTSKGGDAIYLQAGPNPGAVLKFGTTADSWRALLTSEANREAFLAKLDTMEQAAKAAYAKENA